MRNFFLMMLIIFCSSTALAQSPVPANEWTPETRLWLARSLAGEVGWDRHGEYAAVAWVYVTRSRLSKRHGFLQMIKRYSAAIKRRKTHPNPWILHLSDDLSQPKGWPVGKARWKGLNDFRWKRTLQFVDDWQAGKVVNPCPGANHYGGYVDRHRAENLRWLRIKCNEKGHRRFRNHFYDSRRKQPRVRYKLPRRFR